MRTKIVHRVIGLNKDNETSSRESDQTLDCGLTQTHTTSTYRQFRNGEETTQKKDSDDVALVGYKDGLPFNIMADGYYEPGYDGPNKAPIISDFLESEVLPLLDQFIKDCQESDDPKSVITQFIKTVEGKYVDKFLPVRLNDQQVVSFTLSMCVTYRKGDEIRCSGFNIGDQSIVLKKNSGEIKQLGYVTFESDHVGGRGKKDGFDTEMLQDQAPYTNENEEQRTTRVNRYNEKRDAVLSRADMFTEVVEAGDLLLPATSLVAGLQSETNPDLPNEPVILNPQDQRQFHRTQKFVSKSRLDVEQFPEANSLAFPSFVEKNTGEARSFIPSAEGYCSVGDDFLAVQMVIPNDAQCQSILDSSPSEEQSNHVSRAWRAAGIAIGVVGLLFVGLGLALLFSTAFAAVVLAVAAPIKLAVAAFGIAAACGVGAGVAEYTFRAKSSEVAPESKMVASSEAVVAEAGARQTASASATSEVEAAAGVELGSNVAQKLSAVPSSVASSATGLGSHPVNKEFEVARPKGRHDGDPDSKRSRSSSLSDSSEHNAQPEGPPATGPR